MWVLHTCRHVPGCKGGDTCVKMSDATSSKGCRMDSNLILISGKLDVNAYENNKHINITSCRTKNLLHFSKRFWGHLSSSVNHLTVAFHLGHDYRAVRSRPKTSSALGGEST